MTDLTLTKKDFTSDQEVRWCPGCGDYAILSTVQAFLPSLGIPRERLVFISGIGCSSRFPYYVDTYGVHTIHGRAPAVWVVTGDGDALSIGASHLLHALRRNVDITILMFNNRIYGLTKGQYSPTSELGKVTKSTPLGSLDAPFQPLSLALGAEATFVARSIDSDRTHLTSVLAAAAAHRGAAFVEIYQNCNIFNDGAFDALKDPASRENALARLQAGQPVRSADRGVKREGGRLVVCDPDDPDVLVHDPGQDDPSTAFALSRLTDPVPVGVLRAVRRPSYDALVEEQIRAAAGWPAGTSTVRPSWWCTRAVTEAAGTQPAVNTP